VISQFLCVLALALALLAGRRSLGAGLIATLALGFFYGIIRANVPETYSHLLFDAAVAGLYAACLFKPLSDSDRVAVHDTLVWLALLIGWPVLLFLVVRRQDFLVELVGLRASIFFLPFILFGARLGTADLRRIALALAGLDVLVCALGAVQYFVGIEPFFPHSDVTDLIYRSKDLAGRTAYRIPSSFVNAHAYAGTLVQTLPFIGGAWLQRGDRAWERVVWPVAIASVLVAVFMSAVRTHWLIAVVLVLIITFSGRLASGRSLRWLVVVALIAWVVATHERLQRFTTLGESGFLPERITGSVNAEALDLMARYPMGNGFGGGSGSSLPYFLQDRVVNQVGLENEYVRIAMEQGLPGLFLWLLFALWIASRGPGRGGYPWARGRRLAWAASCLALGAATTGTGMLTAIPQTPLMMLLVGWTLRNGPVADEAPADEEEMAGAIVEAGGQ
jgi:hypothetical protein